MKMEKISYGGWSNCLQLSNDQMELVATTDVGPRVIRLAFQGGPNFFKEWPDQLGQTGGDQWNIYGGHRLWHAPEAMPRCYWPDNSPVQHQWDGKTLKLTQTVEVSTGIQKEMELTLNDSENHVRVLHRLSNHGLWDVELAPWSLSVMQGPGRAIIPAEPPRSHAEALLPARPLVLWSYTDMRDPRWIWGTKFTQLKSDPRLNTAQKVGVLNTNGWAGFTANGRLFLKRYAFDPGAVYPDFGCNTEIYTNGDMLEVETLGPLAKLPAGQSVEHVEDWFIHQVAVDESEESIEKNVLPLVTASEKFKP